MGDWLPGAALIVAGLAACAVISWWLFVQTEGVYLGPRVVRWLYDKSAGQYDQIKEFDDEADDFHLGAPLAARLAGREGALVLDVATGTARLPLTLFRHLDFKGRVIGVDASRGMLEAATAKTIFFAESLDLVENDAQRLPIASCSCDAVTCIEALEFLPAIRPALAEMVRVLKPGGALVATNRCGLDRWSFPGRSYAPGQFEALLRSLGLKGIQTKRWLTYYDLIWAIKPEDAAT